MQRDIKTFENTAYDLVIVGGGIYGAALAWEAALRGLRVALLEKGDFGGATSANSLKIIHGGFRYLQSLDILRMRESINERRTLSQIAPHLVHPLPVIVPTYGHRMTSREIMALGLIANEVISFDRNRGGLLFSDPQKRIPGGRTVSKREALEHAPGVRAAGLTGGAIFYDAQVYNSERLVLAYVRSAVEAGAQVANRVRVTGFLRQGSAVLGVQARDELSGDRFEVRGKLVVNTTGPWSDAVLGLLGEKRPDPRWPNAKAINLITRPLFGDYAVGLPGQNGLGGALKKTSFLFVAPWRGRSLLGTTYALAPAEYDDDPDAMAITEGDVQGLLDEINTAYPPAQLTPADVTFVHAGLLPRRSRSDPNGPVKLINHYGIIDHRTEGVQGLMTIVGVKYTTARNVAERAVDRIFSILGRGPAPSRSAVTPLQGGRIERFQPFLDEALRRQPCGLGDAEVRSLVYNYGSTYLEVLALFDDRSGGGEQLSRELALLRAETLYAVREEMALSLADVVLRRTELGTAGHPGQEALAFCAGVMAGELGWDAGRVGQEIQSVEAAFAWRGTV